MLELGRYGIWSSVWTNAHRSGDVNRVAATADAATELEALGFGAIWLGASPGVDTAAPLLAATTTVPIATGILSIWRDSAEDVAGRRAELERRYPGRFLLGLGVSHGHLTPGYAKPYEAMDEYLSALDNASEPVPRQARLLAALGPRMLGLARDRSAGAHPYLVTADHTAGARALLGPDALLAPELGVVLDADLDTARATARGFLAGYLEMPNYVGNLARSGFDRDDVTGGGSNRLLDALFALGPVEAAVARVGEFLAAGADHVAIQVITPDSRMVPPVAGWRELAAALPR
jgi:probable F420-dependent oxidoreductase